MSKVLKFKQTHKRGTSQNTRARHYHLTFNCITCGYRLHNPLEYLCARCKAGKSLFLARNEWLRAYGVDEEHVA